MGVAVTALARLRGSDTQECAGRSANGSASQCAGGVATDGLSDQSATDATKDGAGRATLLLLGGAGRQGQCGDRRDCASFQYNH
jgi:hypothetical protein